LNSLYPARKPYEYMLYHRPITAMDGATGATSGMLAPHACPPRPSATGTPCSPIPQRAANRGQLRDSEVKLAVGMRHLPMRAARGRSRLPCPCCCCWTARPFSHAGTSRNGLWRAEWPSCSADATFPSTTAPRRPHPCTPCQALQKAGETDRGGRWSGPDLVWQMRAVLRS